MWFSVSCGRKRAPDARREQAALRERDHGVVAPMCDERRDTHLVEQRGDLDLIPGPLEAFRHLGRSGYPCELVEPLQLLGCPSRHEELAEDVPDAGLRGPSRRGSARAASLPPPSHEARHRVSSARGHTRRRELDGSPVPGGGPHRQGRLRRLGKRRAARSGRAPRRQPPSQGPRSTPQARGPPPPDRRGHTRARHNGRGCCPFPAAPASVAGPGSPSRTRGASTSSRP